MVINSKNIVDECNYAEGKPPDAVQSRCIRRPAIDFKYAKFIERHGGVDVETVM